MGAENFAEHERLMQELEEKQDARMDRVRQMLTDEGCSDLVDDLDRRLRDIASGVTAARSVWHSISDAQRRALILLTNGSAHLRRMEGGAYAVASPAGNRATGIRLATVRNLASRGLLEWTGGAFDPEASAAPTERLAFVTRHGRPAPGTHFEGFRP